MLLAFLDPNIKSPFTRFPHANRSDERGLSRKHIIESVKASLQRLQVEYIDVVLLHKTDPVCPMEGKFKRIS